MSKTKMPKHQKKGYLSLVGIIICLVYLRLFSPVEHQVFFEIPSNQGVISSEKLLGKNIYLFFGFTKCPHICPTTTLQLGNFLKTREDSVAVFVSVDLKRDTLDVLSEYSKRIPQNFYAGTYPDEEQLKELMKQFNATYSITYDPKKPDNPPLIDHSSLIYVINKKGQWVDQLPYDISSDELNKQAAAIDSKSPMAASHRVAQTNEVKGENTECNLALNTCSLPGLEVSLDEKPVVILKDLTLNLKLTDPAIGMPISADLNGKTINMGYLNYDFKIQGQNVYQAKVNLPFCETPTMEWVLKVLVQPGESTDELKEYVFHFTTQQTASP